MLIEMVTTLFQIDQSVGYLIWVNIVFLGRNRKYLLDLFKMNHWIFKVPALFETEGFEISYISFSFWCCTFISSGFQLWSPFAKSFISYLIQSVINLIKLLMKSFKAQASIRVQCFLMDTSDQIIHRAILAIFKRTFSTSFHDTFKVDFDWTDLQCHLPLSIKTGSNDTMITLTNWYLNIKFPECMQIYPTSVQTN